MELFLGEGLPAEVDARQKLIKVEHPWQLYLLQLTTSGREPFLGAHGGGLAAKSQPPHVSEGIAVDFRVGMMVEVCARVLVAPVSGLGFACRVFRIVLLTAWR